MLLDLKRELESRGPMTLLELSDCVGAAPEAVRGMLGHWIRKGRVRRREMTAGCGGGCTSCASSTASGCGAAGAFEIYEIADAA